MIYPQQGHSLGDANFQKTFTLSGIIDHGLDDRLYYKSLRWTYWNVSNNPSATTTYQVYGKLADGTEKLIAEKLATESVEINDTQDRYTALRVYFPTPLSGKILDVDLRVDVAVKDDRWADIEANLVDKGVANWWNSFEHTTDARKLFNSATTDYYIEGDPTMKSITDSGYMYFTQDYVMTYGGWAPGHYVVPFNLDSTKMVREIYGSFYVRKDDHDGYWTKYASEQL